MRSVGRHQDLPYRYLFADLILSSNTALPELPPLSSNSFQPADQEAPLEVTFSNRSPLAAQPDRWLVRIGGRRRPWMCLGLTQNGYLLRFLGIADFLLDSSGRWIQARSDGRTTKRRVAHLLLDHVLPLALSLRQKTVLHASAVVTRDGCCVFTGPSGSGKSTLAASFQADGAELLSDDCVMLTERNGSVWVTPTYRSLRLWSDSLRHLVPPQPAEPVRFGSSIKHSVLAQAGRTRFAYPVRRIYHLSADRIRLNGQRRSPIASHATVEILPPREGLVHLLGSLRRINMTDPAGLIRELESLSPIVEAVSVKRLIVPHRYDRLDEVREVVRQDLRGT